MRAVLAELVAPVRDPTPPNKHTTTRFTQKLHAFAQLQTAPPDAAPGQDAQLLGAARARPL